MSDPNEYPPTKFQYSGYDYRLSFGSIISRNSITWDYRIVVPDWETAKEMIDLWHETKEYPAVEIDLNYKGDLK